MKIKLFCSNQGIHNTKHFQSYQYEHIKKKSPNPQLSGYPSRWPPVRTISERATFELIKTRKNCARPNFFSRCRRQRAEILSKHSRFQF